MTNLQDLFQPKVYLHNGVPTFEDGEGGRLQLNFNGESIEILQTGTVFEFFMGEQQIHKFVEVLLRLYNHGTKFLEGEEDEPYPERIL
jgi:hypothetical protein